MEIKDNDDITMVQAIVLCLLVLSLYCICYGINLDSLGISKCSDDFRIYCKHCVCN